MADPKARDFPKRTLSAGAIALAAGLIFTQAGDALARPAPESFSPMVKELLPAVVNIATTQSVEPPAGEETPEMPAPPGTPLPPGALDDFLREFFGGKIPRNEPRLMNALGSGFIIDPTGYVVTGNHVIAEADEIRVILSDEREFEAKVVGSDPATDIALLKIESDKPLPHVAWGDSDKVEIGDWVVAIGNPFGLGGSVTAGVLSARARNIQAGPYDDFLQTDASINQGNSGGPLFDMDGKVIGVNTVILSPTGGNIGIGFAVPASTAAPVITQLQKNGTVERGWLGVQIQPVTEDIAQAMGLKEARGALVADVVAGSPAEAAGMKPGDVIVSFAGKKIKDAGDLPRAVANTKVGRGIDMQVWRKGSTKTLQVEVARRPQEEELAGAKEKAPPARKGKEADGLGMNVAPLDPAIRGKLGLESDVSGVVVVDVAPDGKAAETGIRPGDVVTSINEKAVKTPAELSDEISKAKQAGRKTALLRINRGGEYRYVAMPV